MPISWSGTARLQIVFDASNPLGLIGDHVLGPDIVLKGYWILISNKVILPGAQASCLSFVSVCRSLALPGVLWLKCLALMRDRKRSETELMRSGFQTRELLS